MQIHNILSFMTIVVLTLYPVYGIYGMEYGKNEKKYRPYKKKYSTSSSEDNSQSSSSSCLSSDEEKKSEEEKDLAKFLTIGESTENTIFICGLHYNLNEGEDYDYMLKKMRDKISELISKGWHGNHNNNQYKNFSFSSCTFNKKLLEDVGQKLSIYKTSIEPSTHFHECHFEKSKLRSCLTQTAGFKKKSTFSNSTEGAERNAIPNSKK